MIKFFTILICTACLWTGCVRDKACDKVVCENEGVCVAGKCTCLSGYYGNSCELAWNSRFLRNWQVTDTIDRDTVIITSAYNVQTVVANKASNFLLNGLASMVDSVVCERETFVTFRILERRLDETRVMTGGSGRLDSLTGTVKIDYSIRYNDSAVNHTATWRQ